jgi:teichuronic acid exporter
LFQPLSVVYLQAITSIGRSDLYLKISIIKIPIELLLLFISLKYFSTAISIAIAGLLSIAISTLIDAFVIRRLLNYSTKEQIKDVMPAFILSSIMGLGTIFLANVPLSPIIILCIQVITGITIYISLSAIIKAKSFVYILGVLRGLRTLR